MVDVAYLNLSKAFNLVSHRLLLEKIGTLGIDWVITGLIEQFLSGRVKEVSSYPINAERFLQHLLSERLRLSA